MATATIQSTALFNPRGGGDRRKQFFVQWLVARGAASGRLEATARVKEAAAYVDYELVDIKRRGIGGGNQRIRATFKSTQTFAAFEETIDPKDPNASLSNPLFSATLFIGDDSFPSNDQPIEDDPIEIEPC